MTGVGNSAALRLQLAAIDSSVASNTWMFVFGDLNGFKDINDRHSHEAGDVALRAVAARLTPRSAPRGQAQAKSAAEPHPAPRFR